MNIIVSTVIKPPLSAITIEKYKGSRYWAIWVGEDLLAVTVYKKGAKAIKTLLEEMDNSLNQQSQ